MADGAEGLVLALLMVIISKEWGVDEKFKESIISLLFIGILLGSLISGQISDRFGR